MTPEYQDLEIELDKCCCGEPEIRVLRSHFDRPRSPFIFDDEKKAALQLKVAQFECLLLKGSQSVASRRRQLAEEIGAELFELLCHAGVRETFEKCYSSLRDGERMRLLLSFGRDYDRSLGGLPWELLRKPRLGRSLGREQRLSVVRYLDLPERIQPLVVEPPLKVLVVLASPDPETSDLFKKYSVIDLDRHREILNKAIGPRRNLVGKFLHEWSACRRATLGALWEELQQAQRQRSPYHAVHFLCHGGFGHDNEGVLLLETEDGAERPVGASELAACLTEEVRLIVLTSCNTGKVPAQRTGVQHAFAGVASALVAQGKPAVVAMQFSLSEQAAEAFAGAFYEAIDDRLPIDAAVQAGRSAISNNAGYNDAEWSTPVLFLRSLDSQVLKLRIEDGKPPRKTVGIFITLNLGRDVLDQLDYPIDLTGEFAHRFALDSSTWSKRVLGKLRHTLRTQVPPSSPILIEFSAPLSIAFAAGFLLPVNERRPISIRQREQVWSFEGEPPAGATSWLSRFEADKLIPNDFPCDRSDELGRPNDIALIIEASTRAIIPAVAAYLRSEDAKPPRIGQVILACLPEAGQFGVKDGAHAHRLAAVLAKRVDEVCLGLSYPTVHVFMVGPAALAFALGQLFHVIPQTQLYEFDKEKKKHGTYEPSITLVSPEMGQT